MIVVSKAQNRKGAMKIVEYKAISYVKNKVSRIVFGLGGPMFWEGQDANKLLDAVYLAGVNTFDTARVYGKSERTFGKWMAEKNMRDKVVIISKCGHPDLILGTKRVNKKEMYKDLEKSLKELQTNFIDIYLLHRDDLQKDVGEMVETFNSMHADGKIGAFGGSNWTHQRVEQANEYAYKHNLLPFTVSSPNFSLADQIEDVMGGCISISGPSQECAREWYRINRMPIIAYASLAQGLMSGKMKSAESEKALKILSRFAVKGYGSPENYERLRRCEELSEKKQGTVPQIALAWVLRQDLDTFAVVSSSDINRMKSNIEAIGISLSADELLYLDLKKDRI